MSSNADSNLWTIESDDVSPVAPSADETAVIRFVSGSTNTCHAHASSVGNIVFGRYGDLTTGTHGEMFANYATTAEGYIMTPLPRCLSTEEMIAQACEILQTQIDTLTKEMNVQNAVIQKLNGTLNQMLGVQPKQVLPCPHCQGEIELCPEGEEMTQVRNHYEHTTASWICNEPTPPQPSATTPIRLDYTN